MLRGPWANCYGLSYRVSARNIFKVYRTETVKRPAIQREPRSTSVASTLSYLY